MDIAVAGGAGVVGNAVVELCKFKNHKVQIIDPSIQSEYEMRQLYLEYYDLLFICVPTPYDVANERFDYSKILDIIHFKYINKPVCIRSTVAPDFFNCGINKNVVIYHPEFLNARTAVEDIKNMKVRVYGYESFVGPEDLIDKIDNLYNPGEKIVTGLRDASLLKMMHNVYGAMNVAFANEIYKITSNVVGQQRWPEYNDNFSKLLNTLGRKFDTYNKVPGPDGKYGFGGTCFPKDVRGLLGSIKGLNCPLIESIIPSNSKMRVEE